MCWADVVIFADALAAVVDIIRFLPTPSLLSSTSSDSYDNSRNSRFLGGSSILVKQIAMFQYIFIAFVIFNF